MKGIYKITSPSGRIYIGQSIDIQKRFNGYYGVHCKYQPLLYKSFLKYGVSPHVFEVLHEVYDFENENMLDQYEIFYINHFRRFGYKMMNLQGGGQNGKHSEESKIKISETLKLVYLDKNKRDHLSIKLKGNKNSAGYVHSNDWKSMMSKLLTGKKMSQEFCEKLKGNKRAVGSVFSESARRKISETHKGNKHRLGFKHSESFKLIKSKLMKDKRYGFVAGSTKIICVNNGRIYDSQRDASKDLDIGYKHISDVCKGKRSHVSGFKFKYA